MSGISLIRSSNFVWHSLAVYLWVSEGMLLCIAWNVPCYGWEDLTNAYNNRILNFNKCKLRSGKILLFNFNSLRVFFGWYNIPVKSQLFSFNSLRVFFEWCNVPVKYAWVPLPFTWSKNSSPFKIIYFVGLPTWSIFFYAGIIEVELLFSVARITF